MTKIFRLESRIAIVMLFTVLFSFTSVRTQSSFTVNTSEPGYYSIEYNGFFYDFNQMSYTLMDLPVGVSMIRFHRWISTGFGNQGHWQMLYNGAVQIIPMHQTIMTYNSWTGVTFQHIPMMIGTPQPFPGGFFPNLGMDAAAFEQLLYQIDQLSFDRRKLELAQFAISNSGVTVAQLKMLMRRLSFDSNRLTLAKHAYHFTFDRQNFWMLSDAFTFQSNFRELMNSI